MGRLILLDIFSRGSREYYTSIYYIVLCFLVEGKVVDRKQDIYANVVMGIKRLNVIGIELTPDETLEAITVATDLMAESVKSWPRWTGDPFHPVPLTFKQKLQFWRYWFSYKNSMLDPNPWSNPYRIELLLLMASRTNRYLIHKLNEKKERRTNRLEEPAQVEYITSEGE